MPIDWSVVTAAHIEIAIKKYDMGARPDREARNTLLLVGKSRYPAKFIRGLAYQIATGRFLDPSVDYSGGRESVDFFRTRGFTIEYKGKLLKPSRKSHQHARIKAPQQSKRKRSVSVVQKDALEELLKQKYGRVIREAHFPWLVVPEPKATNEALTRIWQRLHGYRCYDAFATFGIQLACDFCLPDQNIIIEYDERQHFTKPRAIGLKLYPSKLSLGFDVTEWIGLCERTDAHDPTPVFRDEQRAYYDAVRDILATQNGVRLVRIRHKAHDWTATNAAEVLERILGQTGSFKVGLLSFAVDKNHREQVKGNERVLLDILNSHPDLDLLVGAGYTLFSRNELELIQKSNRNAHTVVLLETWRDDNGAFDHKGYALRDQKLLIKGTPQVFKTSKEINKKPELMNELLVEIEKNRRLRIGDKWITWLICGEVNVLRNVQRDGNRVEFRFTTDRLLSKRFQSILNQTEIFVNPTHTIMGNQGKLAMRRAYLSADGRTFCSASNVDLTGKGRSNIGQQLGGRSVQYLWKNGQSKIPDKIQKTDQFIFRVFSI